MNISPEAWDMIKIAFGAYLVFCLNKSDRNQRELFKRITRQEIKCAGFHGPKGLDDGENS